MCQDVAVIPFLWVLPLALYLVTFIISFDSPRWYSRFWFTLLLVVAMVAVCHALFEGADMPIVQQVVIYSATMFVGAMICHGELYRQKPHPAHLTSYYLMISAGGAVGGLFVALVAPAIFNNYYEMHLSLALVVLLLLALSFTDANALSPWRTRVLTGGLALAATFGADHALTAGVAFLRNHDLAWLASIENFWTDHTRAGLHWPFWVAVAGFAAAFAFLRRRRPAPVDTRFATCGLLALGLCSLVVMLLVHIRTNSSDALVSARNFYGVLAVNEYEKGNESSHHYLLQHGRITHGFQFASPDLATKPTSYFGPLSGLALALRNFPRQENQRIGLLGLGVGTIAAYGKPGDYLRIYEIDPQVTAIAAKPFTYLARSPAKIDIVMGDGRLSLEHEPPQNFDFIIMDAFSSDAVPVHLLTKEAYEIYQRHLKPDGAIIVNISNRYLDLRPVVENAARAFGFLVHQIECEDGATDEEEGAWWLYGSTFMVLSKNREFMAHPKLTAAASPPAGPNSIPLWTDDYTSMFRVLK